MAIQISQQPSCICPCRPEYYRLNCRSSRGPLVKSLHSSTIPFPVSRRLHHVFSRQPCKAKFDDSSGFGSRTFTTVPPTLLAAEKEEARAVLSLFLRKQGLSNAVAARTIKRSDQFIDHLISKLHSIHKSRYLVGRELTTLEIREALIPYLETLLEDHGDVLVDMVNKYLNSPTKTKPTTTVISVTASATPPSTAVSSSATGVASKKEKAVIRVSEESSDGALPPHIVYLIEMGMNMEQIKEITRKFPSFAYYSLDRKIKPIVEFLLELGVPQTDIPIIICKRPQLCGISLSENLIPTMTYLEGFGVDKTKWAKVIYRFPALLTYSRQKIKTSMDYLSELGVSEKNIGKILTRCPHIISYNVDDKLRHTAEYFHSLGVDVANLMHKCPQTFGLSVEANLKPITEFFIEKGFSVEEIQVMIYKYGALYTFSLADNLKPKWDFFLIMDYPPSELVKFPHFFGYSLEKRIKPRYARVMESGIKIILNQMLSTSDSQFSLILEKKMKTSV
ncbi:Mitochondrial transcription termination factor family protein [Zostera marina]|uniref:Mitochondrial transcription termination factor family protein n=1 Tax=Zostera marina TaxID=29655 RepID=A0A0K9NMY1_ZOSMR|nr:Mitochondrial transcription termination factor family protein [Zostera marina]